MQYEPSVTGKWLAMLKEIAPRSRASLSWSTPRPRPIMNYYLRAAEAAVSATWD